MWPSTPGTFRRGGKKKGGGFIFFESPLNATGQQGRGGPVRGGKKRVGNKVG